MDQRDTHRHERPSPEHEPRGRIVPLTAPRRFVGDLVYFARNVPSVPVSRSMNVAALVEPRRRHPAHPSWAIVFMKAYARVAALHPPLRRALLSFPWPRLYEHPMNVAAMAIERVHEGEPGIFVGLYRAPECQSLESLQAALHDYKTLPIEAIGYFRQAVRVCQTPWFVRRFLWWSTLAISGQKRSKRFGTFGVSTYGALGAEQLHPISPLTTTLTFGPIDAQGQVCAKLVYDHRVLDGAYIARRLRDVEHVLHTEILAELEAGIRPGSARGEAVPPAA
jgi:hypothetical protein